MVVPGTGKSPHPLENGLRSAIFRMERAPRVVFGSRNCQREEEGLRFAEECLREIEQCKSELSQVDGHLAENLEQGRSLSQRVSELTQLISGKGGSSRAPPGSGGSGKGSSASAGSRRR